MNNLTELMLSREKLIQGIFRPELQQPAIFYVLMIYQTGLEWSAASYDFF